MINVESVKKVLFLFVPIMAIMVLSADAVNQTERISPIDREDRTLSPYFQIISDDPESDKLPLKSTEANVTISGVIADVTITQVYKNAGSNPIEAIYVFPASTNAAVYGMKMTIGERVIEAKIKKREDARKDYEQAKHDGKNASLLEQHRPNVFQMNVANIMPGDEIKVELRYNELLIPTEKIYEFVYPAVVGPRYSNLPEDSSSERWVANPYLHEGAAPPYAFDIKVNVNAGMPVSKVESPSHSIDVHFESASRASVVIDDSGTMAGNRDFILRYVLSGREIETGLLLYEGEKENYFLLMMQPPERVTMADIPGREYIFIVDVSGSMRGFPLNISKDLMRNLIGQLRPTDRFNVMLFAGTSSIMSEQSVLANQANIRMAVNHIDKQRGGGGTEILPALKKALALPGYENYSRTIVIATDGYVRVEEEVFDLMRNNLGNANMFTIGIGSSVNRHLIEGMAHVGMGHPFIITRPEQASSQVKRLQRMIQSPVLTDVKVDFGRFETYDVEPLSIPDVLAERPVVVFGKWRGKPEGRITISGASGSRHWRDSIDMNQYKSTVDNSALQYLWARQRIKILSDYNKLSASDERVQEITTLGLTHHLLTAYTSFVAVDSEVRNIGGKGTTVTQPLPLPQGVSDYAVGRVQRATSPGYGGVNTMKYYAAPEIAEEMVFDKRKTKKEEAVVSDITVSAGLSAGIIQREVRKHFVEINKCKSIRQYHGKVKLKLTLDSRGSVKTVEVANGKNINDSVEKCLQRIISQWHFPYVNSRTKTTVSFTLKFL